MDYYAILGVHPTAEDVVIRAAFRALAQRYHPDRFSGSQDEAHQRMSEITKAYEVLADPARRGKYDRRRLTYTQSVANYFNAGPRDSPLIIDPRNLRSAVAMRRRSRVALSALMVAVVALSAFNLVQYSAQIKEWLGAGAPSSATVDAPPRAGADAAAAAGAVAAAAAPQPSSAATPRNLPITQPGPPVATAPATPTPAADPARVAGSGSAPIEALALDAPAAAPPQAAPAPDAAVTPRAAAAEAPRAATAEAPRAAAPGTPAVLAPNAPGSTPAPATASAPCIESVAALGLCSPQTTARNR